MTTRLRIRWGHSGAAAGFLVAFFAGASANAPAAEVALLPFGTTAGAQSGKAVAIRGSYAVVGAPNDVEPGGTRQAGAAYVFQTDGTPAGRLTPSDASTRYLFGRAVAMDGGVLVVGASYAVYIFRHDGANWVDEAKLDQDCSQAKSGSSVAVSGDRVLVGSPHVGCLGGSTKSYVFFYRRSGGIWQLERRIGGRLRVGRRLVRVVGWAGGRLGGGRFAVFGAGELLPLQRD